MIPQFFPRLLGAAGFLLLSQQSEALVVDITNAVAGGTQCKGALIEQIPLSDGSVILEVQTSGQTEALANKKLVRQTCTVAIPVLAGMKRELIVEQVLTTAKVELGRKAEALLAIEVFKAGEQGQKSQMKATGPTRRQMDLIRLPHLVVEPGGSGVVRANVSLTVRNANSRSGAAALDRLALRLVEK